MGRKREVIIIALSLTRETDFRLLLPSHEVDQNRFSICQFSDIIRFLIFVFSSQTSESTFELCLRQENSTFILFILSNQLKIDFQFKLFDLKSIKFDFPLSTKRVNFQQFRH